MSVTAAFAAFADRTLTRSTAALGLAVSGGSDSTALLRLAVPWCRASGLPVSVATVDHGLRDGSTDEARTVAALCTRLGVPHATLVWTDPPEVKLHGNLQNAAREARYALLADWARRHGIDTVALGHTRDDQAETVLMRLARGSGVDGLSGMRAVSHRSGLRWVRPLLDLGRAELRDHLTGIGQTWNDDPSNADPRFDRVRARRALDALADLGIDRRGLARTADRMQRARTALVAQTAQSARQFVRTDRGDVLIAAELDAPDEIRLRLFAAALRWVTGRAYRPRLRTLTECWDAAARGSVRTLHGALVSGGPDGLRITREASAVAGMSGPTDRIWDGRWRIDGPHHARLHVAALGEAVAECAGWRASGLPLSSLRATPAIWDGPRLIASPLARPDTGPAAGADGVWSAQIVADFPSFLESH